LSQLAARQYLDTMSLYIFRFGEINLLLVNRWLSEFSVGRKRLFCWEFQPNLFFWDFRTGQLFMEIFVESSNQLAVQLEIGIPKIQNFEI
jgi:hypothetical protein